MINQTPVIVRKGGPTPDLSGYLTSIAGQDLSTADNTTSAFTTLAAVAAIRYLTAEADTLDTVTGRGATTANAVTIGDITDSGLTASALIATNANKKLVSFAPSMTVQYSIGSAGGSSGSIKMCGMGNNLVFTPTRTGIVKITIDGDVKSPLTPGGLSIALKYGTGTAPVAGAAVSGTTMGATLVSDTPAANASGTWSMTRVVSGLTLNTQLWFDLATGVSGSTVTNMTIVIQELPY
jgi:hypothetical protein